MMLRILRTGHKYHLFSAKEDAKEPSITASPQIMNSFTDCSKTHQIILII